MIFEILKNPIYTYLFVLTLVIFLVIFIWRKLTILESNFYILEKRVNIIKENNRLSNNVKTSGGSSMSCDLSSKEKCVFSNMTEKSIERSNMVMNEIFGNTERNCNKEDVTITFDTSKIIDDMDITKIIDDVEENYDVDEEDNVKNNEEKDIMIKPIIEDQVLYNKKEENCDFENTSNTSEFIFNADEKYTQKKLSKLNLDKLKVICEKMNISTEGTKSQLISRILE